MMNYDFRAAFVLAALLFACDSNDGDSNDTSEMTSAGEATKGVASGGGNGGSGGNDDGGNGGGGGNDGGGESCSMQSPQGNACNSGAACSVSCICANGSVDSGSCINGACADPDEVCEAACADFDAGAFTGSYCALPTSGNDDAPEPDDEGETQCVPTGDACSINGDCCGFASEESLCVDGICADLCSFPSDCVSGCCAQLNGGGAACAPSSVCG